MPAEPSTTLARGEGQATRERILVAAGELFRKNGYDRTPMSKVAKEAGVTTPALYWHFASKEDLCATIVEYANRTMLAKLRARVVGGTPTERLHAYVAAHVELQLIDRDPGDEHGTSGLYTVGGPGWPGYTYNTLRAALGEERQAEIRPLEREYLVLLRGILEEGVSAGEFELPDVSVTTHAISTMCEYVFTWFKANARLSMSEVGHVYADLAVQMVRRTPDA